MNVTTKSKPFFIETFENEHDFAMYCEVENLHILNSLLFDNQQKTFEILQVKLTHNYYCLFDRKTNIGYFIDCNMIPTNRVTDYLTRQRNNLIAKYTK